MKRVYRAQDTFDAHLVRDLLREAGIEAEVLGSMLVGGVGELPADAKPSVWIADADLYDWARQLITRHERQSAEGADWQCPNCGETNASTFEICWSCGRPADGGTD